MPLKERDVLDDAVFSSPLLSKWRFESAASICPVSKAVIHLISLTDGTDDKENGDRTEDSVTGNECSSSSSNSISLLSITGDAKTDAKESVLESREILSQHLRGGGGVLLGVKLAMRATYSTYPVEGAHILRELPVFDLPSVVSVYVSSGDEGISGCASTRSDSMKRPCFLREVVIPHFDSTPIKSFPASALSRPKTGLYQWPACLGSRSSGTPSSTGIVIRPLPTASEDRILPPPSLIFQCADLEVAAAEDLQDIPGTELAKIGFSGDGRGGQYMVQNASLDGLDVRLCDSTELSSSFAEAQDALLSASLNELQSANVMAEGNEGEGTRNDGGSRGSDDESRSDALNGVGDCWIEFRANMKNPKGFFGSKGRTAGGGDRSLIIGNSRRSKQQRVAKAPDLPYE